MTCDARNVYPARAWIDRAGATTAEISAPRARVNPMLKYCDLNGFTLVVLVEIRLRKRLSNHVSSTLARSLANRCSMPASRPRARSGVRSGLPRNDGDGLNDCRTVGSLMPSPALAFNAVSPTAPVDDRATTTTEPRGTAAVPKLSLCSIRPPT